MQTNKAFAILFAITLAAVLLAITLGISNIAVKEIKFSTSARATNEAFFAADTGIECALTHDKSGSSSFLLDGSGSNRIDCLGTRITVNANPPLWDFVVPNLGMNGQSCAKVSVMKDDGGAGGGENTPIITTIISKGYDIGDADCESTNPDRIERVLEIRY